ncbi:hypothetical protein Hypma_012556 [Hypsizygus marmoreus]|uniref:Uncharacterized protein n=1 Tax=Hypsizygus marmoreus TaxID=39966 RepID=A0A369JIZ6_HYPMA|nr:hypothetical protein Hypma_012556 [Hypsizygus marmoreus]
MHPTYPTTSSIASGSAKTQTTDAKLEEYATAYAKYLKIVEDTTAPMRDFPTELASAHERVSAKLLGDQRGQPPVHMRSEERIRVDLEGLAGISAEDPATYDDRIRIASAALSYVKIMMDHVVAPSGSQRELGYVLHRGNKLLREACNLPPLPTVPPRFFSLIPDTPVTRPVTDDDITHWTARPEMLVGKAFVYFDLHLRRVLLVVDYGFKKVNGHTLDVRYEDRKADCSFALMDLLCLVSRAEMVINMPSSDNVDPTT